MEKTMRILRRSIYTFLQNYQCFTTTAPILAFPFAALVLLSESSVPSSSLLQGIQNGLQSFFDAADFPSSSDFNLKLFQTIATSFLVFPLTFTFYLFAKAFVIQVTSNNHKAISQPIFASFVSLYSPLFHTQLCNMIIIISVNATCFCLLFFASNCIDAFGLVNPRTLLFFPATGALLYSMVVASALFICDLALIQSGIENRGGCMGILKACVLIKGRTATALSLALPINLSLAAIEALFQYRIVEAYHHHPETPFYSIVLEGMFIAYLYAVLLVFDTVVFCVFYRSCGAATSIDLEEEHLHQIQFHD